MSKRKQHHQPEELPSIDLATLSSVTGGAGMDMSTMLPMMMMMRNQSAAAAPPPPPAAPVAPKILLNGVEQSPAALAANGINTGAGTGTGTGTGTGGMGGPGINISQNLVF